GWRLRELEGGRSAVDGDVLPAVPRVASGRVVEVGERLGAPAAAAAAATAAGREDGHGGRRGDGYEDRLLDRSAGRAEGAVVLQVVRLPGGEAGESGDEPGRLERERIAVGHARDDP